VALIPLGAGAGEAIGYSLGLRAVLGWAMGILKNKVIQGIVAGIAAADVLGQDAIQNQCRVIAPNAPGNAISELGHQVGRMLGLDGGNVLGLRPNRWGQMPRYYHFDSQTGRAWWTQRYVKASRHRGRGCHRWRPGVRSFTTQGSITNSGPRGDVRGGF